MEWIQFRSPSNATTARLMLLAPGSLMMSSSSLDFSLMLFVLLTLPSICGVAIVVGDKRGQKKNNFSRKRSSYDLEANSLWRENECYSVVRRKNFYLLNLKHLRKSSWVCPERNHLLYPRLWSGLNDSLRHAKHQTIQQKLRWHQILINLTVNFYLHQMLSRYHRLTQLSFIRLEFRFSGALCFQHGWRNFSYFHYVAQDDISSVGVVWNSVYWKGRWMNEETMA